MEVISPRPTASLERMFSAREVAAITSLSVATIYRRMRAQDFPPPSQLSPGRVAWRASVIASWLAKRSAGNEMPDAA